MRKDLFAEQNKINKSIILEKNGVYLLENNSTLYDKSKNKSHFLSVRFRKIICIS